MLAPSNVPQMPLAAALAAIAVALGGCGAERSRSSSVRVLRLNPGALVTKPARGSTPVPVQSTTLASRSGPQLPPAMSVPQVGSIAAGATNGGRLVNGPAAARHGTGLGDVRPDPAPRPQPRPTAAGATDRLLAFLLYVLRDYRLANPGAPPVVIGDLSLPYGGPFGSDFGGLGHALASERPRRRRLLPAPGPLPGAARHGRAGRPRARAGSRQPLRRRRRAARVRRPERRPRRAAGIVQAISAPRRPRPRADRQLAPLRPR